MCDGSGATAWTHDQVGRILKEQRIIMGTSAVNKATQYSYFKDGELNKLTYPSGRIITYTPNSSGTNSDARFASAADVGNSINYVTGATYAPNGGLSSLSNGAAIHGAFSYNSRFQPLQIFYGTNTAPSLTGLTCPATVGNIMHRLYGFAAGTADNGNVISIKNCRDNNRTQNFDYDNLNRIAHAYTTGANWGETFTIDAWGNLTNIGSYPGKTNSENLNAAPASIKNQLNGVCHDAAGNFVLNIPCPTGSFTPTYNYDIENRLTSTGTYSYVYDADGQRVKKCSNAGCTAGTLYWRDTSGEPLLEASVGGTGTEEYVYFNGKRVARRDITGSVVHYYFSDHLGSASVVTNATGTTPFDEDLDYYPYGGVVATSSDAVPQHFKFTGKERDSESGLDNFGRRYYPSAQGRFSSTDPGPYMWADPQTLNRYAYTRNNPLKYVDPTGMYFVVAPEMQAQVTQYISTMLRSPKGAAMIYAISANPKPNFFNPGQLPAPHQVPGTNRISVTNGATSVIPSNSPGAVAGTQTTLDQNNISFSAQHGAGTEFFVGVKAFAHEDAHVADMNAAHTLQQAAVAGEAGDAPTQPGAQNTAGGTAELRALGVMGELGNAALSYQPDGTTDAQADIIVQSGQQRLTQDTVDQLNQAVEYHGCKSNSEGQQCD